jgi:glycosyltransferase involved in cell wall biosynthesis
MPDPNTVVFYYPSKIVGGAELLFCRMAAALGSRGYGVKLVDLPGGIYNKIAPAGVEVVTLSDECLQIPNGAIVIMPPVGLPQVQQHLQLDSSCKILFWLLHPYNLVLQIPGINSDTQYASRKWLQFIHYTFYIDYFFSTKQLLKKSLANHGLAFMDGLSRDTVSSFFGVTIKEALYLPVPVAATVEKDSNSYSIAGSLHLGWIGRLDDFKMPMLRFLLADIKHQATKRKTNITFHIVGSGNGEAKLKNDCIDFPGNLQVQLHGTIHPNDLPEFISTRIDCLFAMGTSALEGAVAAVPTCMVDAAYGKVPEHYRYRWIFECHDLNLGYILNGDEVPEESTHTVTDILQQLEKGAAEIGKLCKAYTVQNHSISHVADALQAAMRNNTNTYSGIAKYMKAPAAVRAYGAAKKMISK